MKVKTGVMVFLLMAGSVFSQTKESLEQLLSGARPPVSAAALTNESEFGGGGPLKGPLYVEPMPVVPKTTYIPKNAPDTLQMYIDKANPGDELVVAPGTYNTGGRQLNRQGPATRLVIDKPLTIRSEAGPEDTFIEGGPSTRCIYMTSGVTVIGFTITGGETMKDEPEGNRFTALCGGGVWSEPGGLLVNCTVISNTALWYGGGQYGGGAVSCSFLNNTARRSGGGASDSKLANCLLAYNRAGRFGGGAHNSDLVNCTVAHNRAEMMGGGASGGTAQNTVLQHNQTLLTAHNFYDMKSMTYCSSQPKARGEGNIGGEPGFKNTDTGVLSLKYDSPLIDAGADNDLRTDITGAPRILDGNNNGHARIDIGAYEYIHPKADSNHNGILDRDEITPQSRKVLFERPAE